MQPSDPIPRQQLLRALYRFQAVQEAARGVACSPGCAACCTQRVYLTSLEAGLLRAKLESLGRAERPGQLEPVPPPAYTCNQLARLCLEQQEPPADPPSAAGRNACVLLEEGRCLAYEARPLACRVMASRQACAPGGQAQGDPWWFTLDTALMQIAEHLDLGGDYGSLGEMVFGREREAGGNRLKCEPLPGLVAPPEHQARLQQTLGPLFATPVQGKPLGLWLDLIRAGV